MQLASNRQRQPPMETAIFRLKELTKRVNSAWFVASSGPWECTEPTLFVPYSIENTNLNLFSPPGTKTGQSGTSLAL